MKKILSEQTQIHSHLTYYRIVTGFPAAVLADRVGISRSNLYKIEHGLAIPSIATVLKLAKVLRVSVEDLFTLKELNERELEDKLCDYFCQLTNRNYSFKKRYLIRSLIKKNKSHPSLITMDL